MKRLMIISSLIALILAPSIFAQRNQEPGDWGRMGGKIEQLEKIKIIEELNMDEETTLKFFSRRTAHREDQKSLMKKKDELYENINNNFNSDEKINYKEKTEEIFKIDRELQRQREKFFNSLSDILTEKQIVQLLVFESNFRKEMRHQFLLQSRRRMKHD